MVNPKDIKEGTRVILLADPDVDLPEERGTCVGPVDNETVTIFIDQVYITDDDDDGIRECSIESIELETILPENLN